MKVVNSYWVEIAISAYETAKDKTHSRQTVDDLIDDFLVDFPTCVTVTPTTFRHNDGHESGYLIRFINYPRSPESDDAIREKAKALGELLKESLGQKRVSIITPSVTYMLE